MKAITAARFRRPLAAHARQRRALPDRLGAEVVRRKTAEHALRQSRRNQRVLLADAGKMQLQVRRLAHKVIRAQEEERKELSRELHDEIVQTLASVNVQLAALKVEARSNSNEARRNLGRSQRLVRNSLQIVYRFARELRPSLLDDLGLTAALESYAQHLSARSGLAVSIKATGGMADLPEDVCVVVYRVAQAALTNVAQHAGATTATVRVRRVRGKLLLDVADNGKAFDAVRAMRPHKNQRLGLIGMRERVEMLAGTFHVTSTAAQGTTVRASIPLPAPLRRRAS